MTVYTCGLPQCLSAPIPEAEYSRWNTEYCITHDRPMTTKEDRK